MTIEVDGLQLQKFTSDTFLTNRTFFCTLTKMLIFVKKKKEEKKYTYKMVLNFRKNEPNFEIILVGYALKWKYAPILSNYSPNLKYII